MSKQQFIRKIEEHVPFDELRFYIKPTDAYPNDFDINAFIQENNIQVPEGYIAIGYKPAKLVYRKFADVPPVDPTPDLEVPSE